jgi:hypothetical protein
MACERTQELIMQVATPTAVTQLPRRQTLQLHARHGERIECQQGELWITQDGDPRDIILGPGQCLTLDRTGTAVISALKDAVFVYRHSASLAQSTKPSAAKATRLPGSAPAY